MLLKIVNDVATWSVINRGVMKKNKKIGKDLKRGEENKVYC